MKWPTGLTSWIPYYGTGGEAAHGKRIPEFRIVLVGRPGAGKSPVGNAILGQEAFEAGPTTRSCRLGIREWEGRRVVLVDTPAVTDLDGDEVQHCLRLCRPGPHALVLVAHVGRFSEADGEILGWAQKVFGREALKHTIVALTGTDPLGQKSPEAYLLENEGLGGLVSRCCGQAFAFGNGEAGRGQAVEGLLSRVEKMVEETQNRPFCILERTQHPKGPKNEAEKRDGDDILVCMETSPAQAPAKAAEPESFSLNSEEEPELRIVLVGKTGGGKSATGNTILGGKCFDSRLDLRPVTTSCQLGIREWQGKRVVVLDTPAIFEPGAQDGAEIQRCRSLCSPGPSALVLVTQVGRFTEEDHQAAEAVKGVFGPDAFKRTVVVFTRVDDLEGASLEAHVLRSDNKHLQELIRGCDGRYCGFNNRAKGAEGAAQADRLLGTIEAMVPKQESEPFCVLTGEQCSELPARKRPHEEDEEEDKAQTPAKVAVQEADPQ